MLKIAIIGTTSWGITLGIMLAKKGIQARIWARTGAEADHLNRERRHAELASDITFPPGLLVSNQLKEVCDDVKAVILAVPSQSVRQNARLLKGHLRKSMLIISAAKGLEVDSGKRMSEVIAEEINHSFRDNICVLSGPNLAKEILRGLPAATVVAAEDAEVARKAQRLLVTPHLCVFTNTDVIGVELGGALKNIIALGAGMADGLGYGDNAKAALVTRGWTEITALGVAMGANPLTFSGLAGLGDLIATCASPLSRNHYVGVELTRGRHLDDILKSMDNVAEGVPTTKVARKLGRQYRLEMPIIERIYRVLYEKGNPKEVAAEIIGATVKHELDGRRWKLFGLFHRHKHTAKVD